MPTPAQIVARIDEKVYDILNDPSAIASYRIGDKQVSKSEIIKYLLEARKTYQEMNESAPAEDIRHVAFDIDDFGQEESEYVGDSLE